MAVPAAGQDVEDYISRYSGVNANGYLQPLADVLGAGLNSGWARSADIAPGFHVKLSAVVAGTAISDDSKTFMGITENFTPETTMEAPTIFGSAETVTVTGQGGTVYRFAAGFPVDLMGTAMPQLTVGSFAGTEAMVRWFSLDVDDDLGKVSLIGFGVRHDLDQYLLSSPLDLAAGVYWQSFELGDAVKVSNILGMVHASRAFSVLTVFGGLGYERSTADITYDTSGDADGVDVSLDGANSVRATAGLSLNFFVVELFADYTLASQSAFTIGLGVGR